MPEPRARSATAFAPGHVTGAFRPATGGRDPRARGSVGLGLVLDAGVRATADWRPSARPRLDLRGDVGGPLPISIDVAARLLAHRPGALAVRLRHELPVGQGFGMSAAGALATALAVGAVVGAPRRAAVATAHLAELFGGGGLGGVAAILGGGIERRVRPGIPPWGSIVRRPVERTVLVGWVGGPIDSRAALADPRLAKRIAIAYAAIVPGSTRPPTWDGFWAVGERFTDQLGLAPRALADVIRGVRRRSGRAVQAMFGRSFVAALPAGPRRDATLRWLGRAGISAVELGVGRSGARLRPRG